MNILPIGTICLVTKGHNIGKEAVVIGYPSFDRGYAIHGENVWDYREHELVHICEGDFISERGDWSLYTCKERPFSRDMLLPIGHKDMVRAVDKARNKPVDV